MNKPTLLITSEHGGNKVPDKYSPLFKDYYALLNTHRGIDFGTWKLAECFERNTPIPVKLFRTDVTRLLVDVNRSLWRRTLFSEISKPLPKEEKKKILDNYYYAHRIPIFEHVKEEILQGRKVIHIAVHSFTPVLKGEKRNADIGLLYNPERANEKQFCKLLKREIINGSSKWRVRYNYPYRGKPDGLTAHFRKLYLNNLYLGIEYEVNQKFIEEDGQFPDHVIDFFKQTLFRTISHFNWL